MVRVALTRETIRISPVRARVEGSDIGYLWITQFNEQTDEAEQTPGQTRTARWWAILG